MSIGPSQPSIAPLVTVVQPRDDPWHPTGGSLVSNRLAPSSVRHRIAERFAEYADLLPVVAFLALLVAVCALASGGSGR